MGMTNDYQGGHRRRRATISVGEPEFLESTIIPIKYKTEDRDLLKMGR